MLPIEQRIPSAPAASTNVTLPLVLEDLDVAHVALACGLVFQAQLVGQLVNDASVGRGYWGFDYQEASGLVIFENDELGVVFESLGIVHVDP
jgi:hypothetical protein